MFYFDSIQQELEERTAQVALSICLADRKPLAATHLSEFQHQNILKKMRNVIEKHGFSNLVTGDMKISISELLSHCLEALSFTSPQEGEAKHIKDLVFSVLLAAVGKSTASSVCTQLLFRHKMKSRQINSEPMTMY